MHLRIIMKLVPNNKNDWMWKLKGLRGFNELKSWERYCLLWITAYIYYVIYIFCRRSTKMLQIKKKKCKKAN